ncbi:MAG: hypothetical protein F6K31_41725, partial [Symploca sp. SIO2G7]|nr:hypothetical protein [Symploca sp. SIO2G7]
MPITISGYTIAKLLYESTNSIVYRGYRPEDNRPVILKILKQAYPPPETIAWFQQEYEITQSLKQLTGVVDTYSLETNQHSWIMVLEDFGGESLERSIEKRSF